MLPRMSVEPRPLEQQDCSSLLGVAAASCACGACTGRLRPHCLRRPRAALVPGQGTQPRGPLEQGGCSRVPGRTLGSLRATVQRSIH